QQFLSRFCAFDHQFEAQNSISNAHSVVFFKQGRWQRSFIFKATKEGTHIVATLQELNFDKTEASGQTGRVHFEGLSLLLTEPQWVELTKRVNEIFNQSETATYRAGTLDENEYLLSYRGDTIFVNTSDGKEVFEDFSEYILSDIIGSGP